MSYFPMIPLAVTAAVGASSAQFSTVMSANRTYLYVADVGSYVAQGANPTAVAGAGAARQYVPANTPILVSGDNGAKLATIQASSGGSASLTPVQL